MELNYISINQNLLDPNAIEVPNKQSVPNTTEEVAIGGRFLQMHINMI